MKALITVLGLAAVATTADAALFVDDFDSGPSSSWGNEVGNWSASGGTYSAAAPDNFPNAHSTIPLDVDDFSLSLTINNVSDGGVWLRSSAAGGTTIGRTGILLVTLSGQFYFHDVVSGNSYGSSLNGAAFAGGATTEVEIQVSGDTYSVYVNGSPTPLTSLTSANHASGRVALYSNSASQSFDNVVLIPEPSAALLALGSLGFLLRRRRTR